VVAGSRFLQKMWSIVRFSLPHISDKPASFRPIDLWLVSKLNRLVKETTERWMHTSSMKLLRHQGICLGFLADNYIELAKSSFTERMGRKAAAQYTLFVAIETISKLLAPFLPYFSEEIYSHIKQEAFTSSRA